MNPQPRGTVCLNRARTDLWGASLDLRVKRPYPGSSNFGEMKASCIRHFAVAFAAGLLMGGAVFALFFPGVYPPHSPELRQEALGKGDKQDSTVEPEPLQTVENFAQSLAEMLQGESGVSDSQDLLDLALRWAGQDAEQAFVHFAELPFKKIRERNKVLVQIIGIWAKTDPEAALAAAEGFPETLLHKDLIHAALTSLAEVDPARAIDLLEAQTKHRWPETYGDIFRIWAERDSAAAIGRLSSLERSSTRLEASRAIVSTLAKSDMDAAVRFAAKLEDGYHRNEVLGQMFYETRVFDPAAGAQAMGLMSAGAAKFWGIENFTLRWAQSDPEAAVEWSLENLRGADRDYAISNLMDVAESRPELGLRLLDELPEGPYRPGAISKFAKYWTKADPNAALAWVEQLGGEDRTAAASGLIESWIRIAPAEAAQYAAALPDRRASHIHMSEAAKWWSDIDPEAVTAWASSLPEESGRGILNEAVTRWAGSDLAAAAVYVSEVADLPLRQELTPVILWKWEPSEISSAAVWVESSLPNPADRVRAFEIVGTVWARADPRAASEWIGALPQGPDRDAAVGSLAREVAGSDVEAASAWAETISNAELRSEALGRLPK